MSVAAIALWLFVIHGSFSLFIHCEISESVFFLPMGFSSLLSMEKLRLVADYSKWKQMS